MMPLGDTTVDRGKGEACLRLKLDPSNLWSIITQATKESTGKSLEKRDLHPSRRQNKSFKISDLKKFQISNT